MYIARHIFPFNATVVDGNDTTHGEENLNLQQQSCVSTWDSSSSRLYDVDVTQVTGGEAVHYEIELTIFSSTSMTEDEIVHMACVSLITDTDNRYVAETISRSNGAIACDFDVRTYMCLATRCTDNHTTYAIGQMPAVSAYGENNSRSDPRINGNNVLTDNSA